MTTPLRWVRTIVRRRMNLLHASERRHAMTSTPIEVTHLVQLLRVANASIGRTRQQVRVAATLGKRHSELAPAHWARWWLRRYAPQIKLRIDPSADSAWVPLGIIDHIVAVGRLNAAHLEIHHDGKSTSTARLSFKRMDRNTQIALSVCAQIALRDSVSMMMSQDGKWFRADFSLDDNLVATQIQYFLAEIARRYDVRVDDIRPTHLGLSNYTLVKDSQVVKFRLRCLSAAKPVTLYDEWKITLRLNRHPGICQPISYEDCGQWEIMTSERALGVPLSAVDLGDLSPTVFSRNLLQLSDIAEYLRRTHIAQLDFHPRNFHLSRDGYIKAYDFDIAALAPPDYYPRRTRSRLHPAYLAPLHSEYDFLPRLGWDSHAKMLKARLDQEKSPIAASFSKLLDPLLGTDREVSPAYDCWHTLLHLNPELLTQPTLLVGQEALKVFCLASIWGMNHVSVLDTSDSYSELLVHEFGLDKSHIYSTLLPSRDWTNLVVLGSDTERFRETISRGIASWDRIVFLSKFCVGSAYKFEMISQGFSLRWSHANGLHVLDAQRKASHVVDE